MKKLIVVADWADGDSLENQEVKSAIEGFLNDPAGINMNFVFSTPSTIHTAFLVAQIVQSEERYGHPLNTVLFQNTDPRIQTHEAVRKAKGANFIIIRLKSGMYVCGPNSGYDFSMLKNKIEEVFTYENMDRGSQFRSRDLYAKICAYLMDSMEDELDLDESSDSIIPTLQGFYIGHIDDYGNIKTTIKHSDLKGKYEYGESVEININKVTKKAKYVDNLFGGTPGELVIYPGSSGEYGNPYLEVSIWRHFTEEKPTTGIHAFNLPRPGMTVNIAKL